MHFAACIPLIVLPGPVMALALSAQDAGERVAAERIQSTAVSSEPTNAAELLDLLESDSKNLADFTSALHRRAYDFGADETEVYIGNLFYESVSGERGRRIAIHFVKKGTLIEEDGKPPKLELRDRNEYHVFDGEWLVEKNVEDKQFIKRQVVKPGDVFDPLGLDGPLPLPFGQSRADVMRLFDTELIAKPGDGGFLARQLKDVYGLKLTPKPGTPAAEDFAEVRVFYDRATLLPAGLEATKLGGNRETIWFFNHQRNAGIEPGVMDTTVPKEDGWRIDIREWRDG